MGSNTPIFLWLAANQLRKCTVKQKGLNPAINRESPLQGTSEVQNYTHENVSAGLA